MVEMNKQGCIEACKKRRKKKRGYMVQEAAGKKRGYMVQEAAGKKRVYMVCTGDYVATNTRRSRLQRTQHEPSLM
jgi:hypothetical protein